MEKNKEPKNCWDFLGCKSEVRLKCDAYLTGSGRKCWELAGSLSPKGIGCPKIRRSYSYCMECPWYQKLNPALFVNQ